MQLILKLSSMKTKSNQSKIGKDFEINRLLFNKVAKKKSPKDNFLIANYINVGYYLITPLLLGVFLGLITDNWLKTKPIFTLIFILLGTVSCFYNLFKTIRK